MYAVNTTVLVSVVGTLGLLVGQTRRQVEGCVKPASTKKTKSKAPEKKLMDMAVGVLDAKDGKVGFKDGKKTKASKKVKDKEQHANGAAKKEVHFANPQMKEDIALMDAQELQDVDIAVKLEVRTTSSSSGALVQSLKTLITFYSSIY